MTELRAITLEELRELDDSRTELVPVPEWGEGVAVRITSIDKALQTKIRAMATKKDGALDQTKVDVLMFAHAVVEPKIPRAEYDLIRSKQAGVIDRINIRIAKISGVTSGGVTSQEAVDEAESSFPEGS